MTKDPTPPSVAGKDSAMPVPATLDEVMEDAFVKNPTGRIGSVGELADRVGHAFGLTGGFREWALLPQHVLDEAIQKALPTLLPTRVKAEVAGDPFANPGAGTMVSPSKAMDQAFRQPMNVEVDEQAGLPKKGPSTVLLLGVAALFVVLGVVGAVVAMR